MAIATIMDLMLMEDSVLTLQFKHHSLVGIIKGTIISRPPNPKFSQSKDQLFQPKRIQAKSQLKIMLNSNLLHKFTLNSKPTTTLNSSQAMVNPHPQPTLNNMEPSNRLKLLVSICHSKWLILSSKLTINSSSNNQDTLATTEWFDFD